MNDYLPAIQDAIAKAPQGHQKQIAIEALRQILRSDLFALAYFLGYEDVDPTVHGEIVAALTALTKRKIICVPRGTFKSSIAAIVYPIWLLIRNPDLRILIDSELYTNSVTYLRSIKGHLESDQMREVFGPFKNSMSLWREDAIIIEQRIKKSLKEASITAGGIGTRKVGQHYDVIIGDDYNSPQNTATKEQAEKVISHYRYNLNILEPEGIYVIIGTRYGEDDLIGHILRETLDEKHLAEGKFKFKNV